MHELDQNFRDQALALASRRLRRRMVRIATIAAALGAVSLGAYAFNHPLIASRLSGVGDTGEIIALPETADQRASAEFALESADALRDPVFLYPPAAGSGPSNRYEIRFQAASSATELQGAVFFVADRMSNSSVHLMTALPATPQDFALMGSTLARNRGDDESAATAELTPAPEISSVPEDGGAGWELVGAPSDLPVNKQGASLADAPPRSAGRLGSGSIVARAPSGRMEAAREIVVKVLTERSVEDVLSESGLEPAAVTEAAGAAARLLNLPRLQPGYVAAFRIDNLPGNTPRRAVVQLSLVSEHGGAGSIGRRADGTYVRIGDPWAGRSLQTYAQPESTAVTRRFRLMDGLYTAGVRNGIPPNVISEAIMQLARNYDLGQFMSPNDRFSLVYSDVPRDRERASGHVYYASVQSGGETLSCYVLKPGRDEDFTCMTEKDTVTQRLGPTGYVTPVDGVLRSAFGPRMHPLLGQVRMHQGVDWAAPPGTPVKAAFDGTVLFAGENGGYGNFVRILHPAGLETGYAHLSGFATNLRKGAQVKAKDIIGYVGSSGLSTGPHLHFELYADGQPVDPFSVEVAAVAQSAGATEKEKVVGRIIRVESGGNPIAKNPLSSATGLGQFLSGTWLRMIRSYRPDLYQQMNDADLLALRTDPSLAREMVFNLAAENEADIKRAGFQATAGNLYLAHFLGSQGAIDVLSVPPETPLVDVVGSSVISANPFLHGRDSAWVIDWAARKMTGRGVSMTTVKRLPPEIRIKNSRFRAYSAAIDKLLESIESSKPKS